MKQRHILWDFNGTLLDDAALAVWCDNQVLAEWGFPLISLADYRRHMQAPMPAFYQALGVDLAQVPYHRINQSYLALFNVHIDRARLRENTLQTLERLCAEGFSHSIVSASYQPTLLAQTESLGLIPWMRRITGLPDEGAGDKGQRGLEHLQALGLAAEEVLLVGDTLSDVALAHTLGCACVLMAGGHVSRDRLLKTGLPVVEDMNGFYRYIREGAASCTADTGSA